MAYYYKLNTPDIPFSGIQVHTKDVLSTSNGPSTAFNFSKHVLIELLDNITPEANLWTELGLVDNKQVVHKRMMVDSHRVHCRRAIVICSCNEEAKNLAERLSQTKIRKRSICAIVIQDLLSDLSLFEKQILQFGDNRSQQQLLFVTDLNRCRDPATLAHYLEDKFSPFGTITSVFVAQDKDGYAYPEGVIKFAHLSEAFAAELAYDQYVVGMERLSVTTHHNILLSQCDLRVRLREAHLRHNNSYSSTNSFQQTFSEPLEIDNMEAKSYLSTLQEEGSEQHSISANGTIDFKNTFPDNASEIEDVLKNPCQDTLMDCLESIKRCSETNKKSTADISSLQDSACIPQNKVSISPSALPTVEDGTWASRITNWIEGISISDISTNIVSNHSTPVLKSNPPSIKDYCKTPLKVTSTVCSFVTCNDNHSANNSCASPISSDSASLQETSHNTNGNITIIERTSSSSSYNSIEENACVTQNSDLIPRCASAMSVSSYPSDSISQSQKRKNQSSLSNKLSLKSQRLNSSQNSIENLTVPIHDSESLKSTTCLSLSKPVKSPVVSLKKLNVKDLNEFGYGISPSKTVNGCERISEIVTVNSLPSRRSSRVASRQSNRSIPPGRKESSVAVAVSNQCEESLVDTPLRAWLKLELACSSNNRVTGSLEKKIVCPTVKKDVLVSVGCSHITCDFCYPGTTNLLLGVD